MIWIFSSCLQCPLGHLHVNMWLYKERGSSLSGVKSYTRLQVCCLSHTEYKIKNIKYCCGSLYYMRYEKSSLLIRLCLGQLRSVYSRPSGCSQDLAVFLAFLSLLPFNKTILCNNKTDSSAAENGMTLFPLITPWRSLYAKFPFANFTIRSRNRACGGDSPNTSPCCIYKPYMAWGLRHK